MKSLFELYTQAADRFESGGWRRGAYGDIYGGRHCLVGGLNEGLKGRSALHWNGLQGDFDKLLPDQVLNDVCRALWRYPSYWVFWPFSHAFNVLDYRNGMQSNIEHWNDLCPWRDQYAVAKVMRAVAAKYAGDYWYAKYEELLAERDALYLKLERAEAKNRNLLARIVNDRTIAADQNELDYLNRELDKVAAYIG